MMMLKEFNDKAILINHKNMIILNIVREKLHKDVFLKMRIKEDALF